jgi:S1-C subfamily serine protease
VTGVQTCALPIYGYVLTNNHVIENATKLEVTTNDNKRYQATLVATDPATDIAVLNIDTDKPLPYLYFGDSDQTRIGEWVLAIGNPFNLNSTVTAGIISAKSRDLNDRDSKNQSYIQTDAAVNMGNSGGALVNTSGELIGINTAITSMSGGFEGYSFAIPSNIARKVFEDLVEFGSVKKGLIGIFGTPVTPDLVASENLSLLEGVYIREVQKGMGAEKAGLKEEDIITQIDDIKIKTFSDLTGYIESKHPGDRVTVEYYRNGEAKTTEVTLEVINQVRFMQMTIENFTAEEKKEMNLDYGLRVLESGAYMYEIRPNSVLLKVNEQPLSSIDDLRKFDRNNIQNLEYLSPNGEKERISFRRR